MNEKETRASEFLGDWMQKAKKFTQPYFDKFERLYNIYLARQDKYEYKPAYQRANLKLPYGFQQVEALKPQLLDAMFSERPYVQLMGRTAEDIEPASVMTDFVSWQMDQMDFYQKFLPASSCLLIYGTTVCKAPWSTKTKKINKREMVYDPETGEDVVNVIPTDEVWYDGPDLQYVPLTDFFPHWEATSPNIQEMRGCVHRMKKSWWDLKRNEKRVVDGETVGIYSNLNELKNSMTDSSGDATGGIQPSGEETAKASSLGQDISMRGSDEIEVWEYWGEFSPAPGVAPEPHVITVANESVVIRCEVNPLPGQPIPFVAAVDYLVDGEFYGIGEIEMIESLIHEGTALRNARLDQANLALNRMFIADRTSGLNVRSIYSRPGGIIWTNDINGIREVAQADVTGSSYREIQQIDFDIQNTTAVINASQGSANVGRAFSKTATGVNYFQKFTSNRIAVKIRNIESFFIKPLLDIIMHYNREFITEDQVVRVTNKPYDFQTIGTDAFHRRYDYVPVAVTDKLMKTDRQQALSMIFQAFMPFIQQFPGFFQLNNFFEDFLKEFEFRDPSRYFNAEVYERAVNGSGLPQQSPVPGGEGQPPSQSGFAPGVGTF